MASHRSFFRNIHFYNASNEELLGGLWQQGSVTEENLLWMLGNILLIVEEDWTIRHRDSGRIVTPSNNAAATGDYDIYSNGSISVTDEPWVARLMDHSLSSRQDAFTRAVRERDRKCVISGIPNLLADAGFWAGYQAARVFPLEHESVWIRNNSSRWISDADDAAGISNIDSVQNGLLMTHNFHTLFNQYFFSVNPDDHYKITTFQPDSFGIDGRILDIVCRDLNNPARVSDQVLRWHFPQSVLANVRGAGEPVFETDFPPGSDIMGTLREEPYGKERFEMELYRRLMINGE